MKRRHVPVIALVLVTSCGWTEPKRYGSRTQLFDQGIKLRSVFSGDTLVYAFAISKAMPVTSTNDLERAPEAEGVTWYHTLRDALWVDGRRVELPRDSR